MKHLIASIVPIVLIFLVSDRCADAKPPLKLSFSSLKADADVVAVVRCLRVMRVPNKEFLEHNYGKYVLLLEVASLFKGENDKVLKVKHFQDLPQIGGPGNPPSSMYFGMEAYKSIRNLEIGQSSAVEARDSYHLVYLRRDPREPGFYIPVTGHGDALQSTYELVGVGVGPEEHGETNSGSSKKIDR